MIGRRRRRLSRHRAGQPSSHNSVCFQSLRRRRRSSVAGGRLRRLQPIAGRKWLHTRRSRRPTYSRAPTPCQEKSGRAAGSALPPASRGIDAAAAALEFNHAEELDTDGVVQIAGAAALLASLPPERWTVVTSCPRKLAEVRLAAAGLPVPADMVTSEEVVTGKPDPYCFLLGAERLGVRPERCLVFEDAPAGVQAGLSAGMRVVQLGQDIPNYLGVQYVPNGGGAFGIRIAAAKPDLPVRK